MKLIFAVICFSVVLQLTAAFCPEGKTGPNCQRYNFAFRKETAQKEVWASHSSGHAVDNNMTSCTLMNPPVKDPWWSVDLGKNMSIEGLDLYVGQETLNTLRTYTVEVLQDGASNWNMCYDHSGVQLTSPILVVCRSPLVGRTVRFTGYQDSLSLVLCDVGVYGACVDGSYGNYCENSCGNCKTGTICNKVTGICPQGCDTGWSGAVCKDVCPHKTYGQSCSQKCGECQYNVTCNRFDGSCPNNGTCEPGYQSPMCQQLCPDGKWGQGCIPCGACANRQPCNKINGTCMNGCGPGYKPASVSNLDPVNYNPFCNITCDFGRYGQDCAFECGYCYNGTTTVATCNITTGRCDKGCASGYVDDSTYQSSQFQCRRECDNMKWGLNCQNKCGQCARTENNTLVSSPCVKADGLCPYGCMSSYQGLQCVDQCSPGTYGVNCAKTCGKCHNGDTCNIVNGTCPGDCENGYTGSLCDQPCPSGTYGFKCRGMCPVNCQSVCQPTDGACVCKDGWTGLACQDVCPENHYGKDCKFVCGNCKPGTTCSQTTGECPQGCSEEWTGLKCDAKKIIEVFERSYGDVIGGVIGGVIGLALITAFIVWVVWRYRKDKSIRIKELAASLGQTVRRLSMRGRASIRRSIQRLSMRGRRQHDQQRLGKDTEEPAQANGTRGNRKHVPRMYECVKLQSNLIHYDDFPRIYLQLQEATPDGRTLLYDTFQSFLAQRPRGNSPVQNGHSDGKTYYNAAVEDVQVEVNDRSSKIPAFLPLGANLSGFLLINAPAASEVLWNHLQQRQLETIISIGKEASFAWRPGARMTIGHDVVECIDVQLQTSHRETKLYVQRMGSRGRRMVRHLECYIWNEYEKYPLIPTLLMFIERVQQIHHAQRERTVLVNYLNLHDQAILFTLAASAIEILIESKRADILRTVAIGGNATAKSVRSFEEFKYLHDVIFQYITSMENRLSSTAI